MLCLMFYSPERGMLLQANGSKLEAKDLAKLVSESEAIVKQKLSELEARCVFSIDENGIIYNRRMVRDEKQRLSKVEAGRRGGLVSKPQAKQQAEQKQDGGSSSSASSSASSSSSTPIEIPPNRPPQGGAPEPPEFLQAWSEYPRRSGGNPRKPGLSAWKARVREGRTTPADALEAVKQYRAWCEATGKIGTETVMQFASFFGPQKEGYLQDWTQPAVESGAVNSEDAEVDRRHLADKKRSIRMMVLDGDVAAAMAEIEHAKTAWRQGLKKYLAELQAIPSLELARASLGDGGGFPAV